jgi:hypothetical protein
MRAMRWKEMGGGLRRLDNTGGWAGGIEPCNNPLPHKDFFIPARPFDSIFDSKAKALVGMTDDEEALPIADASACSAFRQSRGRTTADFTTDSEVVLRLAT